jgi:hypothetical protein
MVFFGVCPVWANLRGAKTGGRGVGFGVRSVGSFVQHERCQSIRSDHGLAVDESSKVDWHCSCCREQCQPRLFHS